ncbi:MAG: hypothetical protein LRZ87_01745 [Methanocellales archaeon]|nr:hypothetical protein [Methanocellales archaeon]
MMTLKTRILKFLRIGTEDPEIDYMCKIVKHNGKKIGESIAVDDAQLLIKHKKEILSIPLDSISAVSDEITVNKFNRAKAKKMGQQWRNERRDEMKYDEDGMPIQ